MKFYLSAQNELIVMEGIGHAYVAKLPDVLASLEAKHNFKKEYLGMMRWVYERDRAFFVFHDDPSFSRANESNINLFAEKSPENSKALMESIVKNAI